MASNTKIQWAHHTFNPWRGCTKVSEGCANCYAESGAKRSPGVLGVWGPNGTRILASDERWAEPKKWNKQAELSGKRFRVFCASYADLFEDWEGKMLDTKGNAFVVYEPNGGLLTVPSFLEEAPANCRWLTMDDVRRQVFRTILNTPHLDWLLLTKRINRALASGFFKWCVMCGGWETGLKSDKCQHCKGTGTYIPPNVWIGTTIENQDAADERLPYLKQIHAKVRFVSIEPLLAPIRLDRVIDPSFLDWAIIGGESGSKARPCSVSWIEQVGTDLRKIGVPIFMKQFGSKCFASYYHKRFREHWETLGKEWPDPIDWKIRDGQPPLTSQVVLNFSDSKGGDILEFPTSYKVRELPKGVEA